MQDENKDIDINADINADTVKKTLELEIQKPYHMQVLNSLNKVCGKAEPNSIIKIRVNSCPIQETKADNKGDWCIDLGFSLPEGCHVVYALGSQSTKNTGRSCFVINKIKSVENIEIIEDEKIELKDISESLETENKKTSNEETVESKQEKHQEKHQENCESELPLPIKPEMPIIVYPLNRQTIAGEFKKIRGKAKMGNIVTVCIRGLTCCTAIADDYGDFTATLKSPLETGSYTVTAFQADEFGNRSATASNAFFVI